MTVSSAVEKYVDHIGRTRESPGTKEFEQSALQPLIDVCGSNHPFDRLGSRFLDAYLREIAHHSLATQKSYWKAVVRASKWWEARGLSPKNYAAEYLKRRERRDEPLPWTTRTGRKQLKRGKTQLRGMQEVEAYLAVAMAMDDPERRVAACLPLLTGIASGELRNLQVGYVDLSANVIRIRDNETDEEAPGDDWNVKTASRRRTLDIPPMLRVDLETLVQGLAPKDYVFRAVVQCRGPRKSWTRLDKPRSKGWLRDLVVAVCKKAEVRITCPHGLRGAFASLKQEEGRCTIADIGAGLGQADHGRTAVNNYIGAPKRISALKVLKGGKVTP